jgi:hypothetical protein
MKRKSAPRLSELVQRPKFNENDRDSILRALSVLDYITHKAYEHGSFSISRDDIIYTRMHESVGELAFVRDKFSTLLSK